MKNTKREKCAEAGRELRQIQHEYLREVARELTAVMIEAEEQGRRRIPIRKGTWLKMVDALEKARRLGL